ncbi:MAG: (d)CMP kinase [Mariprofundaceae bacterium]|nr:(d)CMP kinase [Mariprofundaceae bacterium]
MSGTHWKTTPSLQVAVDGPSGSGKGTVAIAVGKELGLPVLDTGLLYRFAGWQMAQTNSESFDEQSVLKVLKNTLPHMQWRATGVFFKSKDCTSLLRGEDVGGLASQVAQFPNIRTILLDVQRDIASQGCVMDGRDIGTVVLPNAQAKFFLTASQRERARRRWSQLHIKDRELSIEQVAGELRERDERDMQRDCAPLERAKDAIHIDSTTMRVDEVVDRMLAVLERRDLIQPT